MLKGLRPAEIGVVVHPTRLCPGDVAEPSLWLSPATATGRACLPDGHVHSGFSMPIPAGF